MESLGEKLKAARERKGCTFDQISRDTNIARRYLEALESEDFTKFPGEPYLLGFLRNYGEYLSLDTQELITAYRMLKIQEQPVPVEQLLKDPKPSPSIALIAGILVLLVAVASVVVFVMFGKGSKDTPAVAVERKAVEYKFDSGFLEKRFYQGDSALVSLGSERFKLELSKLGENATIATPGGEVVLELGQEGNVDLNGDGTSDIKIFVADLFKNDPSKGVSLRMEFLEPTSGGEKSVEQSASVAAEAAPVASLAAGAPIIISSPNPYPFTLQATFKGYCMFRWESDRKDREERYFHKAEVVNIQSQNGVRLWVSNASAVKLQVIGGGKTVDLEIGGAGEVVVTDLKWVKDDDGRFKLTTVKLD